MFSNIIILLLNKMGNQFSNLATTDIENIKPNNEIKKFNPEKIMYPNQCSQTGFLAHVEILTDVITKDNAYLNYVNITHEQIADRIKMVINKYKEERFQPCSRIACVNHFAKFIIIEDTLTIFSNTYIGSQACPFCNEYIHNLGDTDVIITNLTTKKTITINTLLEHLIRDHNFFEGSVPHRVDPALIIDILNIQPNISYKTIDSKYHWWTDMMFECRRKENMLRIMEGMNTLKYE